MYKRQIRECACIAPRIGTFPQYAAIVLDAWHNDSQLDVSRKVLMDQKEMEVLLALSQLLKNTGYNSLEVSPNLLASPPDSSHFPLPEEASLIRIPILGLSLIHISLHLSSVFGCKDINTLFDYKTLKKKSMN